MKKNDKKLTFVEILVMGATVIVGLFMAAGAGMLFS